MTEIKETESGELVVIKEVDIPALFKEKGCDPIIEGLKKKAAEFEGDISTAKGRKAIASFAAKFSTSKVYIDKLGKALTDKLRDEIGPIQTERNKIKACCDESRDKVRKPLTEWEDAEKKRVADIETRIKNIENTVEQIYIDAMVIEGGITSALLSAELDKLKAVVVDESFEEFELAATKAKEAALTQLEAKFIVLQDAEKEKAEADRLEKERLAKEQEEREAKIAEEAAEKATKEAEEKAKAEAVEKDRKAKEAIAKSKLAEEKAKREKAEAATKAEDEKKAALKAEQDRQTAAKKAAEEAEEEAAKEAEEKERKEKEEREKLEKEKLQLQIDKEKAEREKKEAEALAEKEKKEAAEQAEKDKEAAIEEERQKVADQTKADEEAEEKRQGNIRHRNKIHKEAKASMMEQGKSEEEATEFVTMVKNGLYKHITINY